MAKQQSPYPPETFEQEVFAASSGVVLGPVAAGDTWRFQAHGRWTDWFIPCGPNGYQNFAADVLDIRPEFEDANWFCLVGRLRGVPGSAFRIGEGCEHTFAQDGELEVFANDLGKMRWNNTGSMMVKAAHLPMALGPVDAMADPQRFRGGMGVVRGVQRVLEMCRGGGATAVLVIALSAVLGLITQGRDLIRTTAEDGITVHRTWWFLALLVLFALQAWVWTRLIINTNAGRKYSGWDFAADPAKPAGRFTPTWAWPLAAWPSLLGLLPFIGVEVALASTDSGHAGEIRWWVAGLAVAYLAFVWLRDRANWAKEEAGGPRTGINLAAWWVGFTTLAGLVAMAVFIRSPIHPAQKIGSAGVVFLGVGLLIPWLVIPTQFGRIFRIPVVPIILGLALVLSLVPAVDNHAVGRRVAVFAKADEANLDLAPRPSLDQAYAMWRPQAPLDSEGRPVMVLAVAEGGASRAGFWTGEVLSSLHLRTQGKLANALFAISSVSGGSVGAVGYDVALQDRPANETDPEQLHRRLAQLTGADALSPTLAAFLFPDLLYRFLPLPFLPDRAQALEGSWEDAWSRAAAGKLRLNQPFLALRPEPGAAWRPILMVNGASEETGRRVFTSTILPVKGIDGYDFHALTNRDVPISTAIHNGARFPYVSPAGTLTVKRIWPGTKCADAEAREHLPAPRDTTKPPEDCEAIVPQGHVIDGGYFDAVGTEAARELAEVVARGPGAGDDIHFVFVVISYGGKITPEENLSDAELAKLTQPPVTPLPANPKPANSDVRLTVASWIPASWAANELLAPLRGFFGSRDGHAQHLSVALRDEVEFHKLQGADGKPLHTADYQPIKLCEPDGFEEPMDWVLSGRAKDSMRCAAGFPQANQKPCRKMVCNDTVRRINTVADIINGKAPTTAR